MARELQIRTLFESVPADINAIIGLVGQQAREECSDHACQILPVLDECISNSVMALRHSRVTRFVPLLALRTVRDCIRAGHCPGASHQDFRGIAN